MILPFKYKDYTLKRMDQHNIQLFQNRTIISRDTKEPKQEDIMLGYYATLKQALGGILHLESEQAKNVIHLELLITRFEQALSEIALREL